MWLSFDCTCSIQQRTFGNDEIVVSNGILKVHPDKPFISLLLLPSNVKTSLTVIVLLVLMGVGLTVSTIPIISATSTNATSTNATSTNATSIWKCFHYVFKSYSFFRLYHFVVEIIKIVWIPYQRSCTIMI